MAGHASEIRQMISARGIVTWELDVWHDELAKHRTVRGRDAYFVQRVAQAQLEDWNGQWARKYDAQVQQQSRETAKLAAESRTAEARQALEDIHNTLQHALHQDNRVHWDSLKDYSPYPWPVPPDPVYPPRPAPLQTLSEPIEADPKYHPKIGLMDKLFTARKEQKLAEASVAFQRDHAQWQEHRSKVLAANAAQERAYQEVVLRVQQAHQQSVGAWSAERDRFVQAQASHNRMIDIQSHQYHAGNPDEILRYCEMVLGQSDYPDFFPKEWELDYSADSRALLVDYRLPAPEALPTLTDVRYVATRGEFTEKHLTESQTAKLYDELIYQVVLRTLHELFEADELGALAIIVFNGWVHSIDRSTGKDVDACILSLQARREEFSEINLAQVDPKACFRQLKGVGSSKLHSITAVAPLMRMRRDDGRFVASHEVANQLDEGYNLAAMDWEDFEHLIRELFEREFSVSGGEVKVTRASRDGGVDAVAFDPDPIRGGKIVIQAKRYTNTVSVSAVRDLYGTVMNEGAIKGILVTTSDYGPDAYEFCKGKPLTLLNGGNLLHLLEKHGHRARIDLQEARRLALQQASQA